MPAQTKNTKPSRNKTKPTASTGAGQPTKAEIKLLDDVTKILNQARAGRVTLTNPAIPQEFNTDSLRGRLTPAVPLSKLRQRQLKATVAKLLKQLPDRVQKTRMNRQDGIRNTGFVPIKETPGHEFPVGIVSPPAGFYDVFQDNLFKEAIRDGTMLRTIWYGQPKHLSFLKRVKEFARESILVYARNWETLLEPETKPKKSGFWFGGRDLEF